MAIRYDVSTRARSTKLRSRVRSRPDKHLARLGARFANPAARARMTSPGRFRRVRR